MYVQCHMYDHTVVYHRSIRNLIVNMPPAAWNVLCILIVILLKIPSVVNQNTSGKFIKFVLLCRMHS